MEEIDDAIDVEKDCFTLKQIHSDLMVATGIEWENRADLSLEKSLNIWKCKICGKTATLKGNLKKHMETHVEGKIHSCNICQKDFSTKIGLMNHTSSIHSKLYFCRVCEKSDMNKKYLQYHKKKCLGTPVEQSTTAQ